MKKQYKNLFLLGMVIILRVVNMFAQGPDTLWTKTYGGPSDEFAMSLQLTSDNGYIIAGWTESLGAGSKDVYLIKTDANGDTLWTKTYGGIDEERGYSIQETFDDGYIIAGYKWLMPPDRWDLYLIRTDVNGDTLWTRIYGGEWSNQAHSVQETPDGGYIIAGCTEVELMGDAWLVKTDAKGSVIWTETYGGEATDWANAVQVTSDSGYILAGFTGYIPNWDVYLVRTDKNGNALWTKVYGGPHDDVAWSVQQTPDDGYIVVGYTESFGAGSSDIWLLRTDANGDTLWTKTFGGVNEDKGFSVQLKSDGGYIIAGSTISFGEGEADIYLVRTNASGDTIWTKTYGGIESDVGYSVRETPDEGYIIAGFTCSFGIAGPDVYLIKTEPDVGVEESENPKLEIKNSKLTIYPNPVTKETVIEFRSSGVQEFNSQLPNSSTPQLTIYDVSGRLVKSVPLTNNHLSLGTDFKPGVYFLKLDGVNVGKVIKLR